MMLGDLPRHVPKPAPWPAPPALEPALELEGAPYTIGITPDGKTQFRMTHNYSTITMTLTQQGVIDLIEDLAHTIRKDYEVLICPEDQSDEGQE
jgi:hypothetical protein